MAAPIGGSAHQRGLAGDLVPVNPADYSKMWAIAPKYRPADDRGWRPGACRIAELAASRASPADAMADRRSPGASAATASRSERAGSECLDRSGRGPRRPFAGSESAAGAAWAARLDLAVRTWPRTGDGGQCPGLDVPVADRQGIDAAAGSGRHLFACGESSRFDLSEIGDNGNSIGWGQWNGDRRINLQAIAKGMGTTETDPSAQLAHWNKEISGPYASVLEQVKSAKTAADAARIRTGSADTASGYERPKVNNWQQGVADGSQRFSVDDNGALVDKGGGGGTTVANRQAPAPAPSFMDSVKAGNWAMQSRH